MKFGQLIECNMGNNFLKKSYTKCDKETTPRLFSEQLNWACLWINSLKFYTVCFYCMPNWALSKDIETKFHTSGF